MTFIELTKQRDNTKFLLNYKFIETIQNQENLTYIFIHNDRDPYTVKESTSHIFELIKKSELNTQKDEYRIKKSHELISEIIK